MPLVIGDFVLLYSLHKAVGGQPVHLGDILPVIAPAHEEEACTGQIGSYGKVCSPYTIASSKIFHAEGFLVVYILKGKPRRFDGFPYVEFLAKYAG